MTLPDSVSAVIPVHNGEAFVREAIESVFAQTVPMEVIVVNDGSTDDTAAIIRSYGDRVICCNQEQRGLGAARNTGIRRSSREWIAFLDADDLWEPSKTELQLRAVQARGDLALVFGLIAEFTDAEEEWPVRPDPLPGFCGSAMMARRSVFDDVGFFDESGKIGEFIDWFSRAKLSGARWESLNCLVSRRRVHASNMTRQARDRNDQYLDVLRTHLDRRRRSETNQ